MKKIAIVQELYPLFKCSVTEYIHKNQLKTTKLFNIEFFSKSDLNSDWKMEYVRSATKIELENFNLQRFIQSIKDGYYMFQERNFKKYCMFIVDGIIYGDISLNYSTKEIHGKLINQDLYTYLGPSKIGGDIGAFDLIELLSYDDSRIIFFEEDDLVIIGKFIYMNGEIVGELNDSQFEDVLESPFDFCDSHPEFIKEFSAKAVYHEHELLCSI
jgi:hypothetical protein